MVSHGSIRLCSSFFMFFFFFFQFHKLNNFHCLSSCLPVLSSFNLFHFSAPGFFFFNFFLGFSLCLFIFSFYSCIIFLTFSTSSFSSLSIFQTVVLMSSGLFQGQFLLIFFPLELAIISCSLYVLWLFIENWAFRSNSAVTLEIRIALFPGVCCLFCSLEKKKKKNCCGLSLYQRWAWGVDLRSSQVFFWAFSWMCVVTF